MKKLLFILIAIIIANLCYSQDSKNFKIADGEVIWQKIYESKDNIDQIIKRLKTGGILKNIELLDNSLTATIEDLDADYKGAGFSRGVTPMFLIANKITCSVTIDFKEGRSRITLKHMKLKNLIETPLSKIGEIEPIETYALKKKNTIFKTVFLGDPATILNHTFNKIFEKKESEKEDENW